MESAEAPKGPGWVKLSERTYMNNLEALKKNKTVFKGKHRIDGEWCDIAVKVTVSYDDKSLNEVKLQLKMEDHPNIIRLYDADLIDGGLFRHVYIAMELCSQNLQDFIEERKSIPLDFKLYFLFAEQIVSALAHIHQHNILHRDLKLENILLSSTKDNIRVADFGLSKQLLDGHSVATTSYRGLGTDGYRAPELLHEKPMASYRSDSFSLGIVLAMLFSNGHHPFGPDPSRWRTNITDNKSQDLSHILAFNEPYHHKRELLLDLIKQCLQPDPKARPTPEKILQHGFFYGLMEESTTKTGIVCEVTEDFHIPFSTRGFFEKSGPGWIKLSEKTYMNNLQPIKDRTLVFKGKQFLADEWRPIAVKLIAYDEKSQNEVQLHLKLENHPNIVRMYDAGVTKQPFSYIYIAMELCSQTLKDFIEERKDIPLDFQRYFDFAKQIVSAVAFIHKSNILHRDLKLENILVSPSKDYVRVADLGLSKQILEGHSIATASFRGIGSDGYRAPELLHEKPMASFRSDSFALGIILAMLFSNGWHPYGSDPARWRTNIADNKAKSLTHIVSFKEPYSHKRVLLVDLIEKCLEHDRNGRPTPNEMLQHRFFTTDLPLFLMQGGHASATGVENPFMPEENFNEKGSDARNEHLILQTPAHFERLNSVAWTSRDYTTEGGFWNDDGRSHTDAESYNDPRRVESDALPQRETPAAKPVDPESEFSNDDGRSHTDGESYNYPRRVESDAVPHGETPATKPVDPESESSSDGDDGPHDVGESNDRSRGGEMPNMCDVNPCYNIKNQLFYNEDKLLIWSVFWIEEGIRIPEGCHAKSGILEVKAKHSETIHFIMESFPQKDDHHLGKFIDIKEKFELCYFSDSKCKIFQRRVGPTPDRIKGKFIDLNYHMCAESTEPQKLEDRLEHRRNAQHDRKRCDNCMQGTSRSLVDRSIKICSGHDQTPTLMGKNVITGGEQKLSSENSSDIMDAKF